MRENNKQKSRIGEILLDYGLITQEQLSKALDKQVKTGRRLGSMLEEMGYVDSDTLMSMLSKQHNIPFINLFEVKVHPDVLNVIPFEQVRSFKILPFKQSGESLSLAMADPGNFDAIQNVEFAAGGAVTPFVVPNYQIERAISYFENEGYGNGLFAGEKLREEKITVESKIPSIYSFLKLLFDFRASDLHLTAGVPPSLRINNELKRLSKPVVTSAQMRGFTSEILSKDQMEEFEREKELDFVLSLSDTGRFSINIYKQRNSVTLSARLILERIPSIKELALPEWIKDYALRPHGFILVSGLPGHGKTTTMAAFVDTINSSRKCNIVMIEDPIEYLHKHGKSNVNQREVGTDTESFACGLKHIIRQDPDVIVIGELRDPESIAIALNAAETGHLVIGTMHSLNTTTAIDRILNVFPKHQIPQIRMQLADTLLLMFSQKLIPCKEDDGRIPAYEKLTNSPRITNLIREGKTGNIRSLMQEISVDMSSIDRDIARLCYDGKITVEDGLKFADNPAFYQELIRAGRV